MDRSRPRLGRFFVALLACTLVLPSTGCIHRLLATFVYVVKGTNVEAAYAGLIEKRVVVVCRPPASLTYRYAGAERDLAKGIGALLATNVEKIDVVDAREVENWTDERDADDFKAMARALKADRVVYVDLEDFQLEKGPTLYQGNATVEISVYDMEDNGNQVYQKVLDEVLWPVNSAVPAQEKALPQFRRQYTQVLSEQIARHFYPHDAHFDFASDGQAHR